jgi:hypothetical protein
MIYLLADTINGIQTIDQEDYPDAVWMSYEHFRASIDYDMADDEQVFCTVNMAQLTELAMEYGVNL